MCKNDQLQKGSPMDHCALAARHVKAIVDLLNQHGPTDKIALVAYNREEYNELHKDDK